MTRILIAAVAVLALAGCTAATPKAESAKPAPTPTPTPMSIAAAGTFYLKTVCPGNALSDKINADSDAQNIPAINTDAAAARDEAQAEAKVFDDASILWPAGLAPDLKILRDTDLTWASAYDSLSRATTVDAVNAVSFGDTTAAAGASQRIRLHLNLSADTSASCGH